jgi:hypothetical protein
MNQYIRNAIMEKELKNNAINNEKHTGAIWGAQVSYIGTVHTKM